MPDSTFGQGFTASIVNNTANYLSADRTTLGMVDGATAAIQYVKIVWGGSGEAKFVSDLGSDPSALPISLNNADNWFLVDSIRDTVHQTSSGKTAVRVVIDGSGVCFAGASFGNIVIGAGLTIVGFNNATAANLGVTFGTVGFTAPFIPIRNFVFPGTGVTESLRVTGGMYILGGTVSIGTTFSIDLGSGVTINSVVGGSLPVTVSGGVSLGSGTVNVNLNSIKSGTTMGVVLTRPSGLFYPGSDSGIPVFGVSGATAIPVTIASSAGGLVGVTIPQLVGVTFTGSFSTDLSQGVTINGVRAGAVLGTTISGPVRIVSDSVLDVTFGSMGVTFSVARITTDNNGIAIRGITGATPVPVIIEGGLGGITVQGLTVSVPSAFGISGGTLTGIANRIGVTGSVEIHKVPVGITVAIGNEPKVTLLNTSSTTAVAVKIDTFTTLGSEKLIDHLKGLTVNVSGANFNITGATVVRIDGGSVSISNTPSVSFTTSSSAGVQGTNESRDTNPVGVSLTGMLRGLSGYVAPGSTIPSLMGVSLAGVGVCGGALKVFFDGAGISISGITVDLQAITEVGISGGKIRLDGGTIGLVRALEISGGVSLSGTPSVTFGVMSIRPAVSGEASGTTFGVVIVKPGGGLYDNHTLGVGVVGISAPLTNPVGVTVGTVTVKTVGDTLGVTLDKGGAVTMGTVTVGSVSSVSTVSGTVGTVLSLPSTTFPVNTNVGSGGSRGWIGVSGATFYGIPVIGGIQGETALPVGVSLGGVGVSAGALKVFFDGAGISISGITVDLKAITEVGISGGKIRLDGGTIGLVNIAEINGGTIAGITNVVRVDGEGRTFGMVWSLPTKTFNVAPPPIVGGETPGQRLHVGMGTGGGQGWIGVSGTTFYGIPVIGGISGNFALPVAVTFGAVGATLVGKVHVYGTNATADAIGVTFVGGGIQISNSVAIENKSGETFGVNAHIASITSGVMHGITFGVVPVDITGRAMTGSRVASGSIVGFPIVGVLGATAVGVTFSGITIGGIVGTTFGGITFATTRTIIVGSSFVDGGGSRGIPVFGVAGTTAVRVDVVGGTVAGVFITDAPGITVLGVTTGIPIHGVSGATAVGVTFGAVISSISFPQAGITIVAINGATAIGVTWGSGGVLVTGSVSLSGTGKANLVNYTTDAPNNVPVKPGSGMSGDSLIHAPYTGEGIVVTQKHGAVFARGLTLGYFIRSGTLTDAINEGTDMVGRSGGIFYFFRRNAIPVTIDWLSTTAAPYQRPYVYADTNPLATTGINSGRVRLSQGLWLQLTKWDFISHVFVGYTASNAFEFERNAQIMHKEYQVAPIWAHAMDQFRRWPGVTGNISIQGSNDFDTAGAPTTNPIQKQYVGVIEKPSRLFIPCKDAGEIFMAVRGDFKTHTIGSGFWDTESSSVTGDIYSQTTLYERSHYASAFFGFTGAEPNLDSNGLPIRGYEEYFGDATPLPYWGNSGGYTANFPLSNEIPFIRIWGY